MRITSNVARFVSIPPRSPDGTTAVEYRLTVTGGQRIQVQENNTPKPVSRQFNFIINPIRALAMTRLINSILAFGLTGILAVPVHAQTAQPTAASDARRVASVVGVVTNVDCKTGEITIDVSGSKQIQVQQNQNPDDKKPKTFRVTNKTEVVGPDRKTLKCPIPKTVLVADGAHPCTYCNAVNGIVAGETVQVFATTNGQLQKLAVLKRTKRPPVPTPDTPPLNPSVKITKLWRGLNPANNNPVFRNSTGTTWKEYKKDGVRYVADWKETSRDVSSVTLTNAGRTLLLSPTKATVTSTAGEKPTHLSSGSWRNDSRPPINMASRFRQDASASLSTTTAATPVATEFYMLLASDPQYPWTTKTDDGDETETDEDKKSESEELNKDHVKSMNALSAELNVKGVIINGDLTAYGHNSELKKFKEIYGDLTAPMYLGMGNHDYANNVDNTWQNRAATGMVEYVRESIYPLGTVGVDFRTVDSYSDQAALLTEYTGSMSYSWDIGNVHFVQMHNYPIYEREWTAYNTDKSTQYTVRIKSALTWLANDLAKARNAGKIIILNYHDSDQHWAEKTEVALLLQVTEFGKIIDKYGVSAVFVGHYHTWSGMNSISRNWIKTRAYEAGTNAIPVYFCGSASQSKYLCVKFDTRAKKMTIETVNSKDGASTRVSGGSGKSGSLDLIAMVPSPKLDVPPLDGFVTFFNEGGYVAWYELSYTLNGKTVTKKTGRMALGNKETYEIPAKATNIKVKGEGDVVGTIFDESLSYVARETYKTYGTIGSAQWSVIYEGTDGTRYDVTFNTGSSSEGSAFGEQTAGTNSNVQFRLKGTEWSRWLVAGGRDESGFGVANNANSVDYRIPPLGDITQIEIKKDGYGTGPDWYLNSVTVNDGTDTFTTKLATWIKTESKKLALVNAKTISDYKITVRTGSTGVIQEAGTDSHVDFNLVGDTGSTGFFVAAKRAQAGFAEANKSNNWVKTTAIGTPTKLEIKKDGWGAGPDWTVEKVTVLYKGKNYVGSGQTMESGTTYTIELIDEANFAEYTITVKTGSKGFIEEAGTDSHVDFNLHGDKGSSDFFVVAARAQAGFAVAKKSNSWTKTFTIGKPTRLEIKKDSWGGGPDWFIERVTVRYKGKNYTGAGKWIKTGTSTISLR